MAWRKPKLANIACDHRRLWWLGSDGDAYLYKCRDCSAVLRLVKEEGT